MMGSAITLGSKPKGPLVLTGAGGGASNVLASVPWVAQWKFNNDGNDSIGANNLTNNNSATFTTGLLGGATGATQLVAASSQYWSIADNAALSMGDIDFTIGAWVYLDSKATVRNAVAKWNVGANEREYRIVYDSTADRFLFQVSINGATVGAAAYATNAGIPATATWYCVMAWHDSVANTVAISVNDVAETPTSYSGGVRDGTSPLEIGRQSNGSHFDGRIDNVCIAKSAAGAGGVLSAAQRTAFFNAGVGTETLT